MTWHCDDFERWLDDGRPEALRGPGGAHREACARCSQAFTAALAVENALVVSEPSPRAPAGFTDAVMRRVRIAQAARSESFVLGWLAADPLMATACVLAVLVAWWREPLWAAALSVATHALALAPGFTVPLPRGVWASPGAAAGLGLGLLPVVLWGSWRLMRWADRMAAGAPDGFSWRSLATRQAS